MNYFSIQAPSSKSYSHRYLIGALIAGKKNEIRHLLECDDIEATKKCLIALGMEISSSLMDSSHSIFGDSCERVVQNVALHTAHRKTQIDTKDIFQNYQLYTAGSATLSRILSVVVSVVDGASYSILSNEQLAKRSHKDILWFAKECNAEIVFHKRFSYPPYTITPRGTTYHRFVIEKQSSSQYLSGLLFAGTYMSKGCSILVYPSQVASFPYFLMTLYTLYDYGIHIDIFYSKTDTVRECITLAELYTIYSLYSEGRLQIDILPSEYKSGVFFIPSDMSNASYLLSFGILSIEPVCVYCASLDAIQGDRAFIEIARAMGAKIEQEGDTLIAFPSILHAIDVDMGQCPDLVPTVAILLASSNGVGKIYNIGSLRSKESDRIHAIAQGLAQLGFFVQEEEDALYIGNRQEFVQGVTHIHVYDDHRIAMAFSLFALTGENVSYSSMQCVDKSFPRYWEYHRAFMQHIFSM